MIEAIGFINNVVGIDAGCCIFIPVGLIGLGLLVFWIWMLVDLVQHEPSEGNDKVIWLLVVILVGWIGALVYYFARRPERIRKYGR